MLYLFTMFIINQISWTIAYKNLNILKLKFELVDVRKVGSPGSLRFLPMFIYSS